MIMYRPLVLKRQIKKRWQECVESRGVRIIQVALHPLNVCHLHL